MDTTFLLPVLDELFAAFGRGVMKGVTEELANPTPPLTQPPAPVQPLRTAQRAGAARPQPAGLTSAPAVGASVRYRQGRGAFDATVISVDAERSIATVKRTTDGREVIRPFAKLMPGAPQSAPAQSAEPAEQATPEAAAQ